MSNRSMDLAESTGGSGTSPLKNPERGDDIMVVAGSLDTEKKTEAPIPHKAIFADLLAESRSKVGLLKNVVNTSGEKLLAGINSKRIRSIVENANGIPETGAGDELSRAVLEWVKHVQLCIEELKVKDSERVASTEIIRVEMKQIGVNVKSYLSIEPEKLKQLQEVVESNFSLRERAVSVIGKLEPVLERLSFIEKTTHEAISSMANENSLLRARIEKLEKIANNRAENEQSSVETLISDNVEIKARIDSFEKTILEKLETISIANSAVKGPDQSEFPLVQDSGTASKRAESPWAMAGGKKLEFLNSKTTRLNEGQKAVQKEQFSAVNALSSELNERERRKKNLVVYNMRESKKETREEKQADDEQAVKDLLCQLKPDINQESIKKVIRFRTAAESKYLPIVIIELDDEKLRNELLFAAKNLIKNPEYSKIFLGADMTLSERTKYKELLALRIEKNSKRSVEEKKSFRYGIRGDIIKRFKVVSNEGGDMDHA